MAAIEVALVTLPLTLEREAAILICYSARLKY